MGSPTGSTVRSRPLCDVGGVSDTHRGAVVEHIQLVSQDLSGFFTSIPTEQFHQALQVLLHQYDLKVGLNNVSHWSVYEIKSDHRRRIFKGKWCSMTKVPRACFMLRTCHLSLTLSSPTAIFNGHLFRQERGVAMGSPAAPPLCNLVAMVEDFSWHQTMSTLRFHSPDFEVIWHQR